MTFRFHMREYLQLAHVMHYPDVSSSIMRDSMHRRKFRYVSSRIPLQSPRLTWNLRWWRRSCPGARAWSQCCSRARASALEVYPGWAVTSIRCPGVTSHPCPHLWEIYQSQPILVGIVDMPVSTCSCLLRYLLCLRPVSWLLHLPPIFWLLRLHPVLWSLVST